MCCSYCYLHHSAPLTEAIDLCPWIEGTYAQTITVDEDNTQLLKTFGFGSSLILSDQRHHSYARLDHSIRKYRAMCKTPYKSSSSNLALMPGCSWLRCRLAATEMRSLRDMGPFWSSLLFL